jgi:hypothetical protein
MRKLTLLSICLLGLVSTALADVTFNFTYNSPGNGLAPSAFTITASLDASPNGDGTFTALSGTGTLQYAGEVPIALTLISCGTETTCDDDVNNGVRLAGGDVINIDNQIIPTGNTFAVDYVGGIGFTVNTLAGSGQYPAGAGVYISLNSPGDYNGVYFDFTDVPTSAAPGVRVWQESNGSFSSFTDPQPVAEPGVVSELITMLLGVAGLAFTLRKKMAQAECAATTSCSRPGTALGH